MANVTREIATKEVNSWLNSKKVLNSQRESNEENVDLLIEAVMEGILIFDDKTNIIKHKLNFPLGDAEDIKELTYKHRLNDRMLEPYLKGLKPNDGDGRLAAHICALTEKPRGIIRNMDSVDKKISVAIAVFFL